VYKLRTEDISMSRKKKILSPTYTELIIPTYKALFELGGSGNNSEICDKVIELMDLSDEIVDEAHLGSANQSELEYQLAWARTYLKNYGVIERSARSVWSIASDYTVGDVELNPKEVIAFTVSKNAAKRKAENELETEEVDDIEMDSVDENDIPDENKPWRQKLSEVLINMDPYGFERLSKRVLRECGFTQVEVTKKSGDGGIDGTGKLRINGIFSFNVAFQCKRYKGLVGAGDIRDFRGSLTTDIEKGVFITTGSFSKAARDEASNPGKQQIDLIDGDDFIDKLAEYGIGVKPITTYDIDEEFFEKI